MDQTKEVKKLKNEMTDWWKLKVGAEYKSTTETQVNQRRRITF